MFKKKNNNTSEQEVQREALQRAIANRKEIQVGGDSEDISDDSSTTKANINETKKNAFADGNPADELAAIRNSIVRGQPLTFRGDGSAVTSASDDGHISSTQMSNIGETKKNAFASSQWYQRNKALMNAEIDLMSRQYPDASVSFMKDGRMAWKYTANVKVGNISRQWTFLLIHDADHPRNVAYGGSIKVYVVSPTVQELQIRATNAGRGNDCRL
jgi:hypothetical protein